MSTPAAREEVQRARPFFIMGGGRSRDWQRFFFFFFPGALEVMHHARAKDRAMNTLFREHRF